jgi:hypothetical protein
MKFTSIPLAAALVSLFPLASHAELTKDYPEIVALFSKVSVDGRMANAGKCTGTFITPKLLLTAAHCVREFNSLEMNGTVTRATDGSGNEVPDLTAGAKDVYILQKKWWGTTKINPVNVYVSDEAIPVDGTSLNLQYVKQDLAILEFAADWPSTREVADQSPDAGEAVFSVGFGIHGSGPFGGAGFGNVIPNKSWGRNTISMADMDMLTTNGAPQTCDDPGPYTNDWAICPGDSGGPLIDTASGKVIGVASASGTVKWDERGERHLSIFTDITRDDAVQFIRGVMSQAAH